MYVSLLDHKLLTSNITNEISNIVLQDSRVEDLMENIWIIQIKGDFSQNWNYIFNIFTHLYPDMVQNVLFDDIWSWNLPAKIVGFYE